MLKRKIKNYYRNTIHKIWVASFIIFSSFLTNIFSQQIAIDIPHINCLKTTPPEEGKRFVKAGTSIYGTIEEGNSIPLNQEHPKGIIYAKNVIVYNEGNNFKVIKVDDPKINPEKALSQKKAISTKNATDNDIKRTKKFKKDISQQFAFTEPIDRGIYFLNNVISNSGVCSISFKVSKYILKESNLIRLLLTPYFVLQNFSRGVISWNASQAGPIFYTRPPPAV